MNKEKVTHIGSRYLSYPTYTSFIILFLNKSSSSVKGYYGHNIALNSHVKMYVATQRKYI